MGYIILGVIGIILLSFMVGTFVRSFPKFSYFVYRFSGVICIFITLGILYKFYAAFDSNQKSVLIGSLVFPFFILYFVWLAKITNKIRQSQSTSWWMLFLKFQFGLTRLLIPPLGILASAFQTWFYVEKIQSGKFDT